MPNVTPLTLPYTYKKPHKLVITRVGAYIRIILREYCLMAKNFLQSGETKSRVESLDSRLAMQGVYLWHVREPPQLLVSPVPV